MGWATQPLWEPGSSLKEAQQQIPSPYRVQIGTEVQKDPTSDTQHHTRDKTGKGPIVLSLRTGICP